MSKTRSAFPLYLALLSALEACAPVLNQIYVPEVPPGSLVFSTCAFNAHVPVGATITFGNASASVLISERTGHAYIEIQLEIPAGTEIQFEDDSVLVASSPSGRSSTFRFPSVSLVDTPIVNSFSQLPALLTQQLPVSDPLVGATVHAGTSQTGRHFWLATYVETDGAPGVSVTLPRLKMNGVTQELPRLEFRRKLITSVALLNC